MNTAITIAALRPANRATALTADSRRLTSVLSMAEDYLTRSETAAERAVWRCRTPPGR
jgi:hypothetical protein